MISWDVLIIISQAVNIIFDRCKENALLITVKGFITVIMCILATCENNYNVTFPEQHFLFFLGGSTKGQN